tara:strand:- start:313 stop:501 length:189 start_codon:yes stop_codon:yes gene_type:complete
MSKTETISKEYVASELKTQKENYSKLLEQRNQTEVMLQQTIGVINTLSVMEEKLNGTDKDKK